MKDQPSTAARSASRPESTATRLSDPDGELHLYPQAFWHGDAALVGTRKGLEALRDALNEALAKDAPASAEMFAADGEGYTVHVIPADPDLMGRTRCPYTDDVARDRRRDALNYEDVLLTLRVREGIETK